MDPRRLSSVVDDEAKFKEKHQNLLQEYLYLQKECVSKKRKLKESNERKVVLLDEIRFLKHRHNFLLKKQSQNSAKQLELTQSHTTDAKNNSELTKRYMNASARTRTSTSGQAFQNHRPPVTPLRNSGTGGKEEVAFATLNLEKKAKNVLTNGKRSEKRKISWQDPLALKA